MRLPGLSLLATSALVGLVGFQGAADARGACTFLQPIGGTGSPIVSKQVGRPKLLPISNTNWNTDFIVDQPYRSYKFFFTANSSDGAARYPIQGYMKFTDGSSLEVINELLSPPVGRGRMFGPFPAIPGKVASQMNFKIGTSSDPGATGFSYRISVQGCY